MAQDISTCLWFDAEAEEAANYYVSVFGGDSKIVNVSRYSAESAKASGRPEGSVMTVVFRIRGREFMGLNGGPLFQFTPAISFMVNCETQEEIDHFWRRLSEGGKPNRCGWLQDRFGVSWQIIPAILGKLMQDPERGKRVMQALLQMDKLDISRLQQAASAPGL